MLSPLVLKRVAEPGKLVMASPGATVLSFCLTAMTALGMRSILIGLWTFLAAQSIAIILTYRDPYFMSVAFAFLKCRKTRNYYAVQGNRYEP